MACLDWQMPSNISWQRKKNNFKFEVKRAPTVGKKKKNVQQQDASVQLRDTYSKKREKVPVGRRRLGSVF